MRLFLNNNASSIVFNIVNSISGCYTRIFSLFTVATSCHHLGLTTSA